MNFVTSLSPFRSWIDPAPLYVANKPNKDTYKIGIQQGVFREETHYTLGFLAEISFTSLLYHPRGCLGCPEKQIRSRKYNLFVWFAVFQPKWNNIQKTYKNHQNPLKNYCFGGHFQSLFNFVSKTVTQTHKMDLKVDHADYFVTQGIPRGTVIVEISWFLQFFLRYLTCGAT